MFRNNCAISIQLLITVSLLALPISVAAKPEPVEWLKYFNPIPRKNYDLNESQDRLIKKMTFKTIDLPDAAPVANKEIGLFALVDHNQAQDKLLINNLLSQERTNGLSALFSWKELEPEEDQFNFKPIDDLLEMCAQHNKTLILRVSTCGTDSGEFIASRGPATAVNHHSQYAVASTDTAHETKEAYTDLEKQESDTPKWVFEAGVKALPYKTGDAKTHLMPIFWDTTYLANWSNFIKALSAKYDKNPNLHSVGITGGGILGSTAVVPNFNDQRDNFVKLEQSLKTKHGMSQRQLVDNWKYTADLFPKSFNVARLNFNIDPPIPNRAGEDTLDEISDYLIYRYGARIYLTRQHVSDARHGFDQYRLLLKFHPDTLTGYQLTPSICAQSLEKIIQNALQDGISFAELPANLLLSNDKLFSKSLDQLRAHLGFQLVSQNVTLPTNIKSGEPLKASFTFLNLGNASPLRPSRQFDKDIPSSYKVELELRDTTGKPVVLSRHTPSVPTNQWLAGKPITWKEDLRMPKLKPGQYFVYMSLIDIDSKRKVKLLDAVSKDKPKPNSSIAVGKIQVIN